MRGSLALALLATLTFHCSSASAPASRSDAPAPPSSPAAPPPPDMTDHWGDSTTTAVAVPAEAPNGGVTFENEWIFHRFGRFRKKFAGTGSQEGRRYDVVKIELSDGSEKTVYFDITEIWAKQ